MKTKISDKQQRRGAEALTPMEVGKSDIALERLATALSNRFGMIKDEHAAGEQNLSSMFNRLASDRNLNELLKKVPYVPELNAQPHSLKIFANETQQSGMRFNNVITITAAAGGRNQIEIFRQEDMPIDRDNMHETPGTVFQQKGSGKPSIQYFIQETSLKAWDILTAAQQSAGSLATALKGK